MFILSLLLWLSALTGHSLGQNENIYQWIQNSGKYSKFMDQLKNDSPKITKLLQSDLFPLTVFLPDNNAFTRFGKSSSDLLSTHILLNSYNTDSLLKVENVASYDVQRPKLRFTKGFSKTTNKTEVYVLNARILGSYNVGESMVHIIDRVLDPPKAQTSVAPLALEWINNHNIYPSINVGGGVDGFSSFINSTKAIPAFADCIACTFFVPTRIEPGTASYINRNVLTGHIIPNQILFLRSMNASTMYKTKADSSELSVQLFREVRGPYESPVSYIHSSTKGTMKNRRIGNTRVKVVQGDIPVSNGVVHIIEKPLIITDMSVLDYINEEGTTSLLKFVNLIQQYPSLRNVYSRGDETRPLTLFAFTNEAYESVRNEINALMRNATGIEDLLKLHFVDGEVITSGNADSIKEKRSLSGKELYFSVAADRLYVEGDGVKAATVLQDIACTNGVIHVINKVLGIPSSPIKDKLREDPQLRTTFTVADKMRSDWINRLGNSSKNYTLFAPSEAAWKKLAETDPSSHKQLVDGLYADNAMNILNRHLVENAAISLENLSKMNYVNTVNSQLQIETKLTPGQQQKVFLKYMQLKSMIVRADIKAINGYIHEIDTVIMQDSDLKVDPSAVRSSAAFTRISPAIILISFAAFILNKLF